MHTVWQSRNRNGARTVPVRSAFTTGRMSEASKVKPQAMCCDRGPVALQRSARIRPCPWNISSGPPPVSAYISDHLRFKMLSGFIAFSEANAESRFNSRIASRTSARRKA